MFTTLETNLSLLLPRASVKELVAVYGDAYNALFKADEAEWKQAAGMGAKGLERLRAIKAIITSVQAGKQHTKRIKLTMPEQAYQLMKDMETLETEHVRAIYMNSKGYVLKWEDLSVGNLTSAYCDPLVIFSTAVKLKATSLILVHNHPSGDPTPSEDDILSAKRIHEAGRVLGVDVVDSIVIGSGTYVSLSSRGDI